MIINRKPVISILTTGNEIVDLNKKLSAGQIYNSNKYSLINFIKKYAKLGKVKHVKDNKNLITKDILKLVDLSDIVITVGGVSAGKLDFINDILINIKCEIKFSKVRVKPGKPTTFALYKKDNKKIFIFSLPGNPLSSLFNFHKFILPAIFKLQGYHYSPVILKGRIKRNLNINVRDDRMVMYPSFYSFNYSKGEYIVDVIDKWGSHTISVLNKVNSYILIKGSETLEEGELIHFYPLILF